MNRKHFEIYKQWRKQKYQRDLEKLQNDLADRGIAYSGHREKEEEWLKDECDADINRREAEMKDYEHEKKAKKIDRCIQRITNLGLVAIAILSLGVSYSFYKSTIHRPYVAIRNVDFVEEDKIVGVNLTLINTGIVPANNIQIIAEYFLNEKETQKYSSSEEMFLPPFPTELEHKITVSGSNVKRYINPNNRWIIDILILYDGIETKGHSFSLSLNYNPQVKGFSIIKGQAN